MAAKKATGKKKMTREAIISSYMNAVLENEHTPKSVYKFCKDHEMSEDDFYQFFGSFDGLRKEIWNGFFDHTLELTHKANGFDTFNNKEKMLTFFFTFFELLTANRSYALFSLKEHKNPLQSMEQLKGLRGRVKEFAGELIDDKNDEKQIKLLKQPVSVFSEGAWLQLLFILKYWMEDSSPGFEKTDLVIEKSVRAIFDVFDTAPLESVLDFGKFLWKEKMN